MAYNATTLKRQRILSTTPDARGGGVWFSGNGIAADAGGDIYVAVSDGTFDVNTGGTDYGDSLVRFDADLNVLDYFTPLDQSCRAVNDMDLGSGGPMLLPTQPGNAPNELLISGKGGLPCDTDPALSPIYLLNVDDLGGYNATQDQDVQEVDTAPGGYWSSPAYWQGADSTYVYYGGTAKNGGHGDYLKMFTMTDGLLSTSPVSQSANIFPIGTTPSISANGTSDGILWTVERPDALGILPGMGLSNLYAFDATNLSNVLYESESVLSHGVPRDQGGCANKFAVPTIANGRVYVGTQNELDVFGLLGSTSGPGVSLGNPCWTFKTAVLGNSAKEPIAVYNSGNSTLNISNVTITGTNPSEFSQTNTCTSVAPGAKCVITVTFTPSSVGPQSASVMITDNAPGSPHNIFLDGSGEN